MGVIWLLLYPIQYELEMMGPWVVGFVLVATIFVMIYRVQNENART